MRRALTAAGDPGIRIERKSKGFRSFEHRAGLCAQKRQGLPHRRKTHYHGEDIHGEA